MSGTLLLRADADARRGTGHVMRCVALAEAWTARGGRPVLATAGLPASLRERVLDLQRHFGMASTDVEKILTSTDKIASRGRRIENLDLEASGAPIIANGGASDSRIAV